MKVLVIGGGGREHAVVWALSRSSRVREVLAAPGNAGIATIARCFPVEDHDAVVNLCTSEQVDLVVIGPEAPLAAGLSDRLRGAGVAVFGPGRDGALLEASKAHAKAFMQRHEVPTARYLSVRTLDEARAYLDEVGAPIVVKDSHLAAGKGVTLAYRREEAERTLRNLFDRPSAEVVLEELLVGQELSVMLLTDGRSAFELPLAQDHKQAYDGDEGPMTGGMGAVAPVPLLDDAQRARLDREIVRPVLDGMRADGIDYRGALFLGVMWTDAGPQLLEINVRLGDPETQTVLPLLENDLAGLFEAIETRTLDQVTPTWRPGAAATVVMAAPGYPGPYAKGIPLQLPAGREADTWVFHAGTRRAGDRWLSTGGRVLGVTGIDADIPSAVAKAYREVARIGFEGAHFRTDIGGRLP